jgi:hypothetical protein
MAQAGGKKKSGGHADPPHGVRRRLLLALLKVGKVASVAASEYFFICAWFLAMREEGRVVEPRAFLFRVLASIRAGAGGFP